MGSQMNPFEYFFCGGVGGICSVLVGHPLDTIKVRLQTMNIKPGEKQSLYSGTWDCLTKTIKKEGLVGLYKGIGATLIAVAPTFAISFLGFGVGRTFFRIDEAEDMIILRTFAAGVMSGVFTTTLMTPGERIKNLLQIQQYSRNKIYDGPLDVVKKLYKKG